MKKSFHSFFHFFIPQCVDEWIEGRGHYSIEEGNEFPMSVGIRTVGLDIDGCNAPLECGYYY